MACIWKYPTNFFVTRFDLVDGSKQFRPFHTGKRGYPKGPRPLYRIDDLPDRGALLVVEGERGMARESILPLPRGRAQAGWEPNPLTKAQKNGTEEDWKVRSGTGENGPVQG